MVVFSSSSKQFFILWLNDGKIFIHSSLCSVYSQVISAADLDIKTINVKEAT